MKIAFTTFCLGVFTTQLVCGQTVSPTIISPSAGVKVQQNLNISVTVSSTYQVQSVQASVETRTTNLVFSGTWGGTLSLTGLSWGNKNLIVTATDVFGNTGQVQRIVVYDLPPTTSVALPIQGTVARPEILVSASATDDGPAGATIKVWQDLGGGYLGPNFVVGASAVNTNLSLSSYDGQPFTFLIDGIDSANQHSGLTRAIFVQSSSNLVEIDRVSEGVISDVQPDRILFLKSGSGAYGWAAADTEYVLRTKSRSSGIESVLFDTINMSVGPALLSPSGAVMLAGASPLGGYVTGYVLYQAEGATNIQYGDVHGLYPIAFITRGNYAAWGWGDNGGYYTQIYLTDLFSNTTQLVTSSGSDSTFAYDLAANGDVVFTLLNTSSTNHQVHRYSNGVLSTVVNDDANGANYPKTDGANIYYVKFTPTNQMLMVISNDVESIIAAGPSIGADYLISNGWIAYSSINGGTRQIWRRSPSGTNTQLTFYGTSSTLAGLAPNGEAAFYNGSTLYISKGNWPPFSVATATTSSGLSLFWEKDRWCAFLGRSLYQIYTGTLQALSPQLRPDNQLHFGLLAPVGTRVITQSSADLRNWYDFATNTIADQTALEVACPINSDPPAKFFRLRTN